MKRRTVHAVFAALALCCACWAGYQGFRLVNAERENAAVARASVVASGGVSAGEPARVRLAQAVALSKAGQRDAAAKLYDGLIDHAHPDEIGRAALFDLANLYLREAIAKGPANAIASAPLVELAKNRYRELLRTQPGDWDARYNLERALWLQPENTLAFDDSREPNESQRPVKTPDVELGDLP